MISYRPLWETMEQKGITTYALINKFDIHSKTVYNLKHGKYVSTTTIEKLCRILNCTPNDVFEFADTESK